MGKTPKKVTPGDDERNLYVRRLKATTTSALPKGIDASLPARQRESDNSNRFKQASSQKRLPVPVGKTFKSKLRSPSRTAQSCQQPHQHQQQKALKNPTGFQPGTSKDDRKEPASENSVKDSNKMHPESEESAVQLKVSISQKDAMIEKKSTTDSGTVGDGETCHSSSNGKGESVEVTERETASTRDESAKEENCTKSAEETLEKSRSDTSETSAKSDDKENSSFESDETSILKLEEEPQPNLPSTENVAGENCQENGQKTNDVNPTITKSSNNSEEPKKSENSDDVVESTTSEASDSGNVTQSDKEIESVDQPKERVDDPTFVSYDSSIMLKDVQIKLNDCLKDNSKPHDTNGANSEDNNGDTTAGDLDEHKLADLSFGKTLRKISGRATINRLRYITVREQRFSPNSSVFVNTSTTSFDDSMPSQCIRYPTEISDSIISNGSLADRKRKHAESLAGSAKKIKTEGTSTAASILNTSWEVLKGLRRPSRVSTPKAKGYKFDSDKFSSSAALDEKTSIDVEAEPKKWCVVM